MVPVSKQKHQYKYAIKAESIRKAINKLFFPRVVRAGCMRGLMVMLWFVGKILIRHKTVHQLRISCQSKVHPAYKFKKKATEKLKKRKK